MSEGSAAQMAAYTEVLLKNTKVLDEPVTEIVVFKLKQPHTNQTTQQFETQILANAAKGKGVRHMSWGYALDDACTLVWQLDWARIQDHWDFWQTPDFGPVMAGISELFVPGRPLVRHYRFDPVGMLREQVQLVAVWDQGAPGKDEQGVLAELGYPQQQGTVRSAKGAYAVDMQEETWYCAVFGFASEHEARACSITWRGESYLVKFHDFVGLDSTGASG